MSSASLTATADGVLAAWETPGPIQFAPIGPALEQTPPVKSPLTAAKGKHPVIVRNHTGETLLVWTEGTGWKKGGTVCWQVFGPDGQPMGDASRRNGVPIWGLASAVAEADGNFTIFY